MSALHIVVGDLEVKREPLVPGFKLRTDCVKWTCSKVENGEFKIPPGFAAAVFSLHGSAVFRSNYEIMSRVFPEGHLFIQRGPASHHSTFGIGRHEWLTIFWAQGHGPLVPASLTARPIEPEFASALLRVRSALNEPEDRAEGLILSALQESAAYLSDARSSFALVSRKALDDPNLEAVALAVRQDSTKPWRLGNGSDLAGYSESHFSKVFQEQAGAGFREYVELCRAERAAALLHSTELPIDLVAETVGFPSTVSMRQAFRRAMGLSPSDFRRRSEAED